MRHRGVALLIVAVIALGVSLAAFTSSGPSPTTTAQALCHDILGARALNSEPEKVSTIRQFTYGPDVHPAPNAFLGLGMNQVVGVCWTGRPSIGYELYATASGYKPVRIEGVKGVGFRSAPAPGFIDIP